ncbi:MAG: pteridine-dependent deoxygenase [Lysobacterales bacterium]
MTEPLPAPLAIGYAREVPVLAGSNVLAVLGFGAAAPLADDPRVLRVGLEPLGPPMLEIWRASTPVRSGRHDALRWSTDGEHLFFAIEVDETVHGGISGAAEHAYRVLSAFVAASETPHLLRLWNYLDAINLEEGRTRHEPADFTTDSKGPSSGSAGHLLAQAGAGRPERPSAAASRIDDERYRLFCDGRARGMRAREDARYPAATAIGRQDGVRVLQVYGLAARHPGTPIENPRQVSAWRYPREYGPTAPIFARGMRSRAGHLLISGTAAVVGHASQHRDDLAAQIDETLANLDSLVRHAGLGGDLGAQSILKAYLRDPADADFVRAALATRAPALGGLILLAGDICRRELLVELDGVQRAAA